MITYLEVNIERETKNHNVLSRRIIFTAIKCRGKTKLAVSALVTISFELNSFIASNTER